MSNLILIVIAIIIMSNHLLRNVTAIQKGYSRNHSFYRYHHHHHHYGRVVAFTPSPMFQKSSYLTSLYSINSNNNHRKRMINRNNNNKRRCGQLHSSLQIQDIQNNDNDDIHLINEHNWKQHPSLSETVQIPTVFVPNDSLQHIIQQLSPYLATKMKEFENIHPRLKVIQDYDIFDEIQRNSLLVDNIHGMVKVVLLDPRSVVDVLEKGVDDHTLDGNDGVLLDNSIMDDSTLVKYSFMNNANDDKNNDNNNNKDDNDTSSREERINILQKAFPKMNTKAIEVLTNASAFPGPVISKTIPYDQQPIQRILYKILPEEALPPPTGFEQIGHVIHLNLKEKHIPYRKLIGSVILDRLSPKVQSVVNKVGEVSGPYRTYEMELLAGKPDTMVEVIEDGVSLHFDLSKVYWCTRLSGERSRLIQNEFKQGQIIADAFCGVGALCVLSASKLGCTIYANDLNPDAVKYLKESAKKVTNNNSNQSNNNTPSINVQCGDAFDFIQNLGLLPQLPHHIIMNYPLDSASFLGAFRWWSASDKRLDDCPSIVHLYTFARGDDPNHNNHKSPRSAMDVAIDLVADGLIPEGGAIETSRYRKAYLNQLGCDVKAHEVRDVAPGKVVICVSFKITTRLLSAMQGEFL